MNYDALRNYNALLIGSTVVVQREDRGLWIHGRVVKKEDQNHNDQAYRICIIKTGWIITRNSKHGKVMPITLQKHLRDQLSKDRKRHIKGHDKTEN